MNHSLRNLFKAFAICATSALALASFQARADMLADVKAAGVLRIGIPQDNPPFGIPGPDMKIVGYDVDMANLIGEKLGVKVMLIPTTSGNRVPYIQSKRLDIIVASLGKNPDREKVLDFSEKYAPFFIGVYSTKGIEFKTAQELAGKTVGVTRGANEDLEITKIAPAGTTIQRFDDIASQMSAYRSGQVDVIASSNTVAAALAAHSPNRAPVLRLSLKDSPCYVGVPKGQPALLSQINAIIAEARANGTLSTMSRKWFKADLPQGF